MSIKIKEKKKKRGKRWVGERKDTNSSKNQCGSRRRGDIDVVAIKDVERSPVSSVWCTLNCKGNNLSSILVGL